MDPLAAARALLPAWLPFASLLALPLGFAAGWLAALVLTPLAYRRALAARDAHWTERARLAWPARKWSSLALVAVPAVLGAFVAHLGGPLSLAGRGLTGFLGGTAALAGYALGTYPSALSLQGPSIGGRWRHLSIVAAGTLPAVFAAPLRRALAVPENAPGPPDGAVLGADAGGEAGPKPAPLASGRAGRFALLLGCVAAFVAAEAGFARALPTIARRSPLAAVALTGGEPWPLSELARSRAAVGRPTDAVAFYRAAYALDGRPGHLANAAFVENRSGRCPEARALADEALRATRRAGVGEWDRHLAGRAVDVAGRCGAETPGANEED